MCVFMYYCVHVYMYIRLFVCMHTCICVYIYIMVSLVYASGSGLGLRSAQLVIRHLVLRDVRSLVMSLRDDSAFQELFSVVMSIGAAQHNQHEQLVKLARFSRQLTLRRRGSR